MANNPLQQYFRQPKIYIALPVSAVYSRPGTINSTDKMPIFGMTGMDELILKTPDALLSGESTARVIASCCPAITDPWGLANIEVDLIIVAIRIATYGNMMTVNHTCPHCQAENEYEFDLGKLIEHFSKCKFSSSIAVDNLVIKIKPLDLKTANEFSLTTFALQKKIIRVQQMEDPDERDQLATELIKELNQNQIKIIQSSIEQIDLADQVVTERAYILEFLNNCDRDVFEKIRLLFEENAAQWRIPPTPVKCTACDGDSSVQMELNQTNFFGGA